MEEGASGKRGVVGGKRRFSCPRHQLWRESQRVTKRSILPGLSDIDGYCRGPEDPARSSPSPNSLAGPLSETGTKRSHLSAEDPQSLSLLPILSSRPSPPLLLSQTSRYSFFPFLPVSFSKSLSHFSLPDFSLFYSLPYSCLPILLLSHSYFSFSFLSFSRSPLHLIEWNILSGYYVYTN